MLYSRLNWQVACGFLIIAFVIVLSAPISSGQELFFIYGEPLWHFSGQQPLLAAVFRLDNSDRRLLTAWEYRNDSEIVSQISVYASEHSALLVTWFRLSRHYTFILADSAFRAQTYYWPESLGTVVRSLLFIDSIGELQLELQHVKGRSTEHLVWGTSRIRAAEGKEVSDYTLAESEFRLTGPGRVLIGSNDGLWLNLLPDGTLQTQDHKTVLLDVPVPGGLVTMKDSRGWDLIASESLFQAMYSVPGTNGLTHRELLVLNRLSNQWTSLLVPGNETFPRQFNNWLAGVIADSDPKSDFRGGRGAVYPAILREESVIIHPLSSTQFTVHLGQQSEVLWIEDSTAYYRVQDSLFTARIADDDFKDRKLILTDPRVLHIHWAFRGGEGDGQPTPGQK